MIHIKINKKNYISIIIINLTKLASTNVEACWVGEGTRK